MSVPVANRTQPSKNPTEQQAPLSPETPASRPESNTPPELALGDKEKVGLNEAAAVGGRQQPAHGGGEAAQQEAAHARHEGALVGQNESGDVGEENNNMCPEKIGRRDMPMSPKTIAPRLWLPKNRNTDQVFITDVTVNLQTVTIRECKTEQGFFREREMNSTTT